MPELSRILVYFVSFFSNWIVAHYSIYFFFFNDTPTPEISPLSLHAALPIYSASPIAAGCVSRRKSSSRCFLDLLLFATPVLSSGHAMGRYIPRKLMSPGTVRERHEIQEDRKSTRLNSSHLVISYAVFCLTKK